MADNFENIQEGFEYITEAIDSMRAQNAMNVGDFNTALLNITSNLEKLANDESSNLIKVFLAELKRSLDERHDFVSSKFEEIEILFNKIVEETGDHVKSKELRTIFDTINANLEVFAKNSTTQKELISELNLRIEDFSKDDSTKNDILKNISMLKTDLGKFGNGFESIIINLNDNFSKLSGFLSQLDPRESFVEVKKDIENIFLSSNAVLSTLQVIDRKNKEFEDVINQLVTKEDFNLERDQVAKLITQNIQITEYMNILPTQDQMANLTERIDTTVGVINALKNVIAETGAQNQQILTAQLDNLEKKILNISSEDEFIGFRKELSAFAQEVIQSTNLIRSDLAETTSSLKGLLNYLNAMDIKTKFEDFSSSTKISEANVQSSISNLSKELTIEIDKSKNATKSEINESTSTVTKKLETVKEEITENSKLNLSSILEHLQGVINNIFSIKTAISVEGAEHAEAIDSKFEDLKENLSASNNFIIQNSHENLENILDGIEKVFQEITTTKETLNETCTQGFGSFGSKIDEISVKLKTVKDDLNQNSQEVFSNLAAIVTEFSNEISGLKSSLEQNSEGQTSELKEFIGNLIQKFNNLQEILAKNAEVNVSELRTATEELIKETKVLGSNLEQISVAGFSGLKADIEEFSQELKDIQDNFDIKNQSNLARIVSLFQTFNNEFNSYKDSLNETAKENFETISLYIQSLNQKIEDVRNSVNDDLKSHLSQMQETISFLPQAIKENQAILESEKNALLSENSKNIEELNSRIQSLINGLATKDSPFKENVLQDFEDLKSTLETIKRDLGESNQILGEVAERQIGTGLQRIEELISQYNEKYNLMLLSLKNNIVEYFDSVQTINQESNLKLNNSLQETAEIKNEMQTILDNLSVLANDSSLADLSIDISRKLEGILLNITQLEGVFTGRTQDSLQNVLKTIEEKFETLSVDLNENKNIANAQTNQFINEFEGKIENILDKLNENKDISTLQNSEIIEDFENKFEAISNELKEYRSFSNASTSQFFEDFGNKFETFSNEITNYKNSSTMQTSQLIEEFRDKFDNFSDELTEYKDISATQANQFVEELDDKLEIFLNEIIKSKDNSGTQVNQFATELENKFEDLCNEFNTSKNSIKIEANRLAEIFEAKFETISDWLNENNENKDVKSLQTNEFIDNFENKFEILKDELGEYKNALALQTNEFVEDLKDKFETIGSQINLTGTDISNILATRTNEIISQISPISDSIDKILTIDFDHIVSDIKNQIDSSCFAITPVIKDIIKDESAEQIEQISADFNTLNSKLKEISAKIGSDNTSELEDLKSVLDTLTQSVEGISTTVNDADFLNEHFINVGTSISEAKYQNIEAVNDALKTILEKLEESNLSSAIKDLVSSSQEEILERINAVEENIIKSQDNVKISIIDELRDNIESIKENLSSLDIEESLSETLTKKIESLEEIFQSTSKEIESQLSLSEENNKASAQSLLSSIKADFYEKVDDLLDELKSFIEVVETKRDFSSDFDDLRSDIFDKLSQVNDDIEGSIISIDVKKDLEELNGEIQHSINNLLDNLEQNFASSIENNHVINDISDKSNEMSQRIEELRKVITENIDQKLDQFEAHIDDNKKDFAEVANDLKSSLAELKESYIDLGLNSAMEMSTLLVDIQGKIDALETKFNSFDFNGIVEASANETSEELKTVTEKLDLLNTHLDVNSKENLGKIQTISEKIDSLSAKSDSNTKNLEEIKAINEKLDLLCVQSDSEIKESIDEIKQIIEAQKRLVDQLEKLKENESISDLDELADSQSETQSILKRFEKKLDTFSDLPKGDGEPGSIKDELDAFKSELFENLVEFFNQISFSAESEDIKDFINEKSKQTKEAIKNNFTNILSNLDNLYEKASSVDNSCFDIKAEIEDVKKHLLLAKNTTGNSDYSYTMEDVESDIAKIRLILKELSESKPNIKVDNLSDLDRLNENIVSISTRTNKLLLNSDESYLDLKDNLNDFKDILYQLDERLKHIGNVEKIAGIEKKLEDVNKLMVSSTKTDKIFNQTFMYLAQWVDSAGANINSIVEKTSDIDKIKLSVSELQKSMPKKSDLETVFDKITKKFDTQQEKIKSLEAKIDKLTKQKSPDLNIKAVVSEVLAQIEKTEAKSDGKLVKKVDNIDNQLSILSESIGKLTSYVDEG